MNSEKTLKITVLGKNYTVLTNEQEQNVLEAARLYGKMLQEKLDKDKYFVDQERVALVVALELATELIKMQSLLASFENRVATLVDMLNNG
jgi:cell division protein ZapA (FtsZ GTPase activity inhibitor)